MLHPSTRGGAIGVVRLETGADENGRPVPGALVSTEGRAFLIGVGPEVHPPEHCAALRNAHLPDRFRRPLGRFRAWTTARSARSRLMPVACPPTAQMMLIGRAGSVSRCARAGAGAVCGRLREVLYGCRQSDHCTHPDDHATPGVARAGMYHGGLITFQFSIGEMPGWPVTGLIVGLGDRPRLRRKASVTFCSWHSSASSTASSGGRLRPWTMRQSAVKARYRFKKREITKTGGRIYYLKPVSKKRWIDKKVPEWTAALDDDRSD